MLGGSSDKRIFIQRNLFEMIRQKDNLGLGCLYVYMIYTKSVYIACIYTLYIQKIQFSYTGVYIHIYKFFENFIYSVYIHYIYKKCIYHIYRFENHYWYEGILTKILEYVSYATLKIVYIHVYIQNLKISYTLYIYIYTGHFQISYTVYIYSIYSCIYSKIYIHFFVYMIYTKKCIYHIYI